MGSILLALVAVLVLVAAAALARKHRLNIMVAAGLVGVGVLGAAAAAACFARRRPPGAVTGAGEAGKNPLDMADYESVEATAYSAPRPGHARQEVCFFRRLDPEKKFRRVIDATAHVGVDSHVLAATFGCRVDAVECVAETFAALQKNAKTFGGLDVVPVRASAAEYLEGTAPADLVYMDPPWGGPGYAKASDLPLYDAEGNRTIPLGRVVNLALKVAPVVVVKVPHNFGYRIFEKSIAGHVVGVSRIKSPGPTYARKRPAFLLLEIRRAPLHCPSPENGEGPQKD